MFEKKYLAKAAEEEKKQGQKMKREEAKQKKKNKVPKHRAKRKFFKAVNDNVECNSVCTFAREESNVDVSFVVMIVKIYIMNYAYQTTTKNTFQFQKMVTLFSVTAATKKKIQTTVQMK
jgi:hypothetical protein